MVFIDLFWYKVKMKIILTGVTNNSSVAYLSFPVIQKVGKVGILVQLLMRINKKWTPIETILM